ncbi:NAD(P)-dependent dehydrogenase, short-chain alcohol dehydrogenase family [Streptomyces sp. DvalAA-14]|uniref:SDR family NAD(P)-dependent oxidoreductase n=1 Tax=unclassified Streptomyces TaxID=2593676 RepID=UPI00081B4715|nr:MULTISPECIES: SDR family NAD(P)-dependent oxidoreductase [unclassified Streptomyces]MYS24854.1 SDR family NAD(P)-dependent oxidoreductase [Streptomyces sp. SID4948]SCE49944.1 NAD(P)-dependent dehydrogenase, short-chain alcohol dehydrogenase family [Streptomyces sp. DvalAA-14]
MSVEKTRITTPFDAESTAAEVVAGTDLTGRRAIVTGAASGIGVETARALAGAGAEVTLAVRDPQAGERTAADITATTGNKQVHVGLLDLADQGSVAAFVGAWDGPLHILINNAGVMMTPELRTPEGWELQLATNHFGHFALTTGLHDALVRGGQARVVSLTSIGHQRGDLDFDDPHFRSHPYDPVVAYGQSKTATALFAVEADRRWSGEGITVNAVHPGAVLETGLSRHMSKEALDRAVQGGGYTFKTPQQGAATSVLVATWPALEGVGGRYFEDCNEALPYHADRFGGVAPHALDPAAASRLWQLTLDTLGARG